MSTELLTALSREQQLLHDDYLAQAISFGTKTDPADRSRAEAAFRQMYAWLDQPEPDVIWVDSPYVALQMLTDPEQRDSYGGSLNEEFEDFLLLELQESLETSLLQAVSEELKTAVTSSLGRRISLSLEDSVSAALWQSLKTDPPRNPLWDPLEEGCTGQLDNAWTTCFQFFRHLFPGLYPPDLDAMLNAWIAISESCGWWWPRENLVIASERPAVCRIDQNRFLHADDGPALQYRDGTKLWSIHGVYLPATEGEQIVMHPQEQTIEQIRAEPNEEVRRVRLERYGWQRYLGEAGADLIDCRRNDVDGTFESLLRLDTGEVRLLCACRSTGRVYALGVPQNVTTAAQAQNWMFGGNSLTVKRGICLGAS